MRKAAAESHHILKEVYIDDVLAEQTYQKWVLEDKEQLSATKG